MQLVLEDALGKREQDVEGIMYNRLRTIEVFLQRAPVVDWTTLKLAGFYIQAETEIPLLPRSEIQNADIRHFGNPKCRISA